MARLGWLGWGRTRRGASNLKAIHARVRELLPDDEAVLHRYVLVVAVLLTRVAQSDGRVERCELDHLGRLLRHVDRLPNEGVESLCSTLRERVPQLTEAELEACYRELRSLCDAKERLQVIRLLATQATVEGSVDPLEHVELARIATALDVPLALLEQIEVAALSEQGPSTTASDHGAS